jgi:hypothetical protein
MVAIESLRCCVPRDSMHLVVPQCLGFRVQYRCISLPRTAYRQCGNIGSETGAGERKRQEYLRSVVLMVKMPQHGVFGFVLPAHWKTIVHQSTSEFLPYI